MERHAILHTALAIPSGHTMAVAHCSILPGQCQRSAFPSRSLFGLLTACASRAKLLGTHLLVNMSSCFSQLVLALQGDNVLAVLLSKLPCVPGLGQYVRDGTNKLYTCHESSAPVTVLCPRTCGCAYRRVA